MSEMFKHLCDKHYQLFAIKYLLSPPQCNTHTHVYTPTPTPTHQCVTYRVSQCSTVQTYCNTNVQQCVSQRNTNCTHQCNTNRMCHYVNVSQRNDCVTLYVLNVDESNLN